MTSTTGIRRIVVDDSDSKQIQYTGPGWFRDYGSHDSDGTWGPPYQHTLHGTKVNGSLSFKFNGTDINVLGTTDLAKTSTQGIFDPTWECFVDKISIGRTEPFTLTENNWDLCAQHEMADGQHELVINISSAGQAFWFDSIRYTPSPGLSLESVVMLVNNDDPGIHYDSHWIPFGGVTNTTQAFNSTANFSFAGTSVSWIGMIPKEYPGNSTSGTYSIDGGAPTSFTLQGLDPGPAQAENQFNQIFFTTPELPAGPHSLSVVYQGGEQYTPLTLDFLYVTNNPNPNNPSDVTHTSPHPNTRKDSIGAIVGYVAGGIATIALVLALILYFMSYRRQHARAKQTNVLGNEISPFPYVSWRPNASTINLGIPVDGPWQWRSVTKQSQPTQSAVVTLGPSNINFSEDLGGGALPIALTTEQRKRRPLAERSDVTTNGNTQRQLVPQQESGLRLGPEILEDNPPSYTAT